MIALKKIKEKAHTHTHTHTLTHTHTHIDQNGRSVGRSAPLNTHLITKICEKNPAISAIGAIRLFDK